MTRAIVIGGSVAGMCAAKVLSDFVDDVLVIERDRLPRTATARAGIPQGRHAHALLRRGQQELETLFPGFEAAMIEAGALKLDSGREIAIRRRVGWSDIGSNHSETLWASRDLIEFTVRGLMTKQRCIRTREGCRVSGLRRVSGGTRRIDGVLLTNEQGDAEQLDADIVVDASGRNSRAESWLRDIGLEPPVTDCVDANAGYASRFYRAPPPTRRPSDWWWRGIWIDPEPGCPRSAAIFPIEHDRWIVTAAGIGGDHPPTDEEGFSRFLNRLVSPAIAQAVELAEPISAVYGSRAMANVFRRYDRWRTELLGFIAIGDAVCAFNPIYGQGMTSAAVSASILKRTLVSGSGALLGLESEYFRRQASFLKSVWSLSTGADFQWSSTVGKRPRTPAILKSYVRAAIESAHLNAALRRHIIPVFDLTGSAVRFFHPTFMARVLLSVVRRRALGGMEIPLLPLALGSSTLVGTSPSVANAESHEEQNAIRSLEIE